MALLQIKAVPHANGNRVDLSWVFPETSEYTHVRITRREDRYPQRPDDGLFFDPAAEQLVWEDSSNLASETYYYYSFFPYTTTPLEYFVDRRNRISAMATAPYGFSEMMSKRIPVIYHRYDTLLPPSDLDLSEMSPEDLSRGQLRRFLELPGGQLDQLYSFIKSTRNLKNLNKTPGELLPLLAEWVGWKIDSQLQIDEQRSEIKKAPQLFATLGMLPVVGATVKRISSWESNTKEFLHNIARSNTPERLNLWQIVDDGSNTWGALPELTSLDYNFEGRPCYCEDDSGQNYLFYHTQRNTQWDIWYKTIDSEGAWQPSQRLTNRPVIDKHPVCVNHNGILRLFWNGYDNEQGTWKIYYRSLDGNQWSAIQELNLSANEKKLPSAVMLAGSLWLFWLEKTGPQWVYRYAQAQVDASDSTLLGFPVIHEFPMDGSDDPQVQADPFVLAVESAGTFVYVCWSRKLQPDSTYWEVVYRRHTDNNLLSGNWSAIHTLPKISPDNHDRDPYPIIQADGTLELFWSSTSGQNGWSVWRRVMSSFDNNPNANEDSWETPQLIMNSVFSDRTPLVVSDSVGTRLLFRSNRSVNHDSVIYSATKMVDGRYAGTTSFDTRNAGKRGLHRKLDDFQTFTIDTGKQGVRDNNNWYGRDTIGIYLDHDTMDEQTLEDNITRLKPVVHEFMPLTDRAVFISKKDVHTELVYHYDQPPTPSSNYISSVYMDVINTLFNETVLHIDEDFSDHLE